MSDYNLKQEHLEMAVRGLLEQDEFGFDTLNRECVYKTCEGNKCVVGQLVEDKHYTESMEGLTPFDTPVMNALQNSLGLELTHQDKAFLRELQECHDYAASEIEPNMWTFIDQVKLLLKRYPHFDSKFLG